MNWDELDKRNHKIIEKIGLGLAFEDLCRYINWEDLWEWQGYIADDNNIDLYEEV